VFPECCTQQAVFYEKEKKLNSGLPEARRGLIRLIGKAKQSLEELHSSLTTEQLSILRLLHTAQKEKKSAEFEIR
jgi:hypothetical protein